MGGKSTRVGTYKCYQCRKPFTTLAPVSDGQLGLIDIQF
jgi:hypothetical protein